MQKESSVAKPIASRADLIYEDSVKSDIEEAIRSSASLLEFAAEMGSNQEVNATTVFGIANILRTCEHQVHRYLYTQSDIQKCGGDPNILRRKGVKR
jgi:hypothetical protein